MKKSSDSPLPTRGGLDALLTSELRFYIMTVLALTQTADFNYLKRELEATDGNLSANLTKLEEAGYLTTKKEFIGKKAHSSYTITPVGLAKLSGHLDTMTTIKNRLTQESAP